MFKQFDKTETVALTVPYTSKAIPITTILTAKRDKFYILHVFVV